MPRAQSSRLIPLLLIVLTALVFGEVPSQYFLTWDDNTNVYENPYLNPVTPASVLHFWQQPYFSLYMPLTDTVWALAALSGRRATPMETPTGGSTTLNPHVFHAVNLLCHLAAVLLVYALLRRLLDAQSKIKNAQPERHDWAAGAGALLFGLHPVQVEPVAWITGLNNVLGGSLSLLALWLYVAAAQAEGAARQRRGFALATVAFALALLAKPTSVVVPVLAVVLDGLVLRRPWRRVVAPLGLWLALALACAAVTQAAQKAALTTPDVLAPGWARPLLAGDALTFYLHKVVWPWPLGVDYGRTPAWVLSQKWVIVAWLVPLGLALAAWRWRQRWPYLAAAVLLFLAAVLPMTGLTPYYFHAYSIVADRYLYLAMLGPAVALADVLHRVPAARGVAVIGLALLGFASAFQTLYWYDSLAVFTHALEVNPRSWGAHVSLGKAMEVKGRPSDAMAHYQAALDLNPRSAVAYQAHTNLGVLLAAQGHSDAAIRHFQEALRLNPQHAPAYFDLGNTLLNLDRNNDAIDTYRAALRLNPEYLSAYQNLGLAYAKTGRFDEAATQWEAALRLRPDFAPARAALEGLRAVQSQVTKDGASKK